MTNIEIETLSKLMRHLLQYSNQVYCLCFSDILLLSSIDLIQKLRNDITWPQKTFLIPNGNLNITVFGENQVRTDKLCTSSCPNPKVYDPIRRSGFTFSFWLLLFSICSFISDTCYGFSRIWTFLSGIESVLDRKGNSVGLILLSIDLAIGHLKSFSFVLWISMRKG